MLVDEDGSIWFRQSWMETAHYCLERGRNALVRPEFNESINDAALIGTATHAEIAADLRGELDPADRGQYAFHEAIKLCEENTVKWTKWTLPEHLAAHAQRCAAAWHREIRPHVPRGGAVETEFAVPLFTSRGRQVGLKGTIDYADPTGIVWDWKTASRKYEQRGKQRTGIQPTVYGTALMHGAIGEIPYQYPITFNFGVMVRGDSTATTQIVAVQRTHNHELWLLDQMQTYIDLADGVGVLKPWPRDEDHFLCNSTWCPWWSVCKGARLTDAEDTWRG